MPNENPLKLLPQPRHVRLTSGQFDRISSTQVKIAPTLSRPQGYRVEIDDQGDAKITVHDDAGLFYANKTLEQIQHQLQLQHGTLQTMVIEDWPDFLVRGFMLDISRDKVPTMQTLFQLVDLLAELKINQLQLYTEHTFAYRDHEIVWKDASISIWPRCRRDMASPLARRRRGDSAFVRRIREALRLSNRSTTNCCRISPAGSSTSAAMRRWTSAWAAARRRWSSAGGSVCTWTSSSRFTPPSRGAGAR
jgi:hypothetical protein